MRARSFATTLAIMLVLPVGGLPGAVSSDGHYVSIAHAQSRLKTLIDQLRGANMPEGIAKTNGRIEATQVDVAAKYAGRLASVTVKEGDEVTAGQVIARISSPEYEAQLRGARAQVLKAKQALAEAEALIAQRKADQIFAKTDLERGQPLVEKLYPPTRRHRGRDRHHHGDQYSVGHPTEAKPGFARKGRVNIPRQSRGLI